MFLAKLALPVLLVTGGAGAAAYASVRSTPTTVVAGAPDAWIDGPLGDKVYAPGTIGVYAYATANEQIRGLQLEVDGEVVATDGKLERTEKLYAGTFAWKAAVGTHQLRVRPVGGVGRASSILVVEVGEGGVVAPTITTPTAGATIATTSSTPTNSPTSPVPTVTAPTDVFAQPQVTVGPPVGGGPRQPDAPQPTRPPATAPPNTTPPPTAPPAALAVIDAASTSSPAGDNRLYVAACAYRMEVTATVRNASSVQVQVEGTGAGGPMKRSGNTYSYTLQSGQFAASDVGSRRVLIVASGGGANPTAQAGQVDVRLNCPKD